MLGIIICTYNRPEYLRECLDSLKRADLSKIQTILIVDDASTDKETIKIIEEFEIDGIEKIWYFKPKNKSIKDSLLYGFDFLFEHRIDTAINLDSDAIVINNFVDRLLKLKNKYPKLIVSGFNCNTLNKNGTVRHQHLYKEDGAIFRASVGGINMCIQREQYLKYVKPALLHTLEFGGNWDALSCINSMKDSLPIAVTVPSVIQHVGSNSSMNHGAGGEPMDEAQDFKELSLLNVSLICVDCINPLGAIGALIQSSKNIKFGAVKFLSHWSDFSNLFMMKESMEDIEKITIDRIGSKKEYSEFIFNKLVDYIQTDFFILVQADGFIINSKAFDKDWFNYDYIGARWHFYSDGMDVGNGGVSWRSKKLHEIIRDDKDFVLTNDHLIKECNEDHNICRIYRPRLEGKYGIKFAPTEVAERFSIEAWKNPDKKYKGSFAFHGGEIDFSNSNLEFKPY